MRRAFIALSVLVLLGACASVGKYAFQSLIGQHIGVQVPAALAFPDEVVLELGQDSTAAGRIGSAMLGAMLGESLEAKVGKSVKKAAEPLSGLAAAALKQQVVKAQLFGRVSTEPGDVSLNWGIGRWGLVFNKETQKLMPVLDLTAALSVPGLGTVWRGSKSAADLGQAAKEKAAGLSLATLAGGPKSFQDVMDVMLQDLGGQLLVDLASAKPGRRVASAP